jgi:inorganic pyrophosphatase/exopolyphosphatase
MDRDKFLDLMKNLQTIMKCPSCGALYDVNEIQFVGSQDGYFLLSMTCSKCALPVWVNFFAGSAASPKIITDLTVSDFALADSEPISVNEVIDFHHFIGNFKGNFKRAFKK